MSGGGALIDHDRDGRPDVYFTNAQSVDVALAGRKSRSAPYHNNPDGTLLPSPTKRCWLSELDDGRDGQSNNDDWPDLLVTCFGGVVLYRNNGDGTFTEVTKEVA